jgi:LCP family protein required for cell wall assembly
MEFDPDNTAAEFVRIDILEDLLDLGATDYIYEREAISDRVINVLFLGDDARIHQNRGRSDTIILISYNRDTRVLSLTSFIRDILIPTNLNGTFWGRINAMHAIGGPGRAINVINNLFSLDIQRYAVVRFSGVFELVDALEGLELNLTDDEAEVINRIFPDFDAVNEGYNLLNGRQVLAYSRMRILDNDFARTQRQRYVLTSLFNKILDTSNIGDIFTMASFALDHIETNVPLNEIISLALDIFNGDRPVVEELRIPVNDSFNHGRFHGANILTIDFGENITALHESLYGCAVDVRIPYIISPLLDHQLEQQSQPRIR